MREEKYPLIKGKTGSGKIYINFNFNGASGAPETGNLLVDNKIVKRKKHAIMAKYDFIYAAQDSIILDKSLLENIIFFLNPQDIEQAEVIKKVKNI